MHYTKKRPIERDTGYRNSLHNFPWDFFIFVLYYRVVVDVSVLKNRKGTVFVVAVVLAFLAGGGVGYAVSVFGFGRNESIVPIDARIPTADTTGEEMDEEVGIVESCADGFWVDVGGAVAVPGVYCLPVDGIVRDGINEAAGFSADVCAGWVDRNVNQAEMLEPNSKVYVPGKKDVECASVSENNVQSVLVSQGSSSAVPLGASASGCSQGKISLNSASQSEVESLTDIGPVIAGRIVAGRPYAAIEDIMEVEGIGQKTFESIKGELCL